MDFSQNNLLLLGLGLLVLLLLWGLAWMCLRLLLRLITMMAEHGPGSRAWARMHPLRAWLQGRFPRGYGFLAARLDPRQFTGLPLTLLGLAALYIVSLTAGFVEDVVEAEEMVRFDTMVNDALHAYRGDTLVRLFTWITGIGSSEALIGVVMVSTGFLWAHQRLYLILPLWLTYVGAEVTTWSGKFVFARVRPEFVTGVTALSPSFPSAHATGTLAVYGFVAYAIARDLGTARRRFEVTWWTLVVVGLVGFSRMFLSVHYFSDVLVGFLVGLFWLLAGFTLAEYTRPTGGRV